MRDATKNEVKVKSGIKIPRATMSPVSLGSLGFSFPFMVVLFRS